MRLTYFGHSAFLLEVPPRQARGLELVKTAGARLALDPWLADNPHCRLDPAKLPCDYALCTHAHGDHIGDALNLARLHGATLVAPYELAAHFEQQGARTIDLMPGGGVDLPWGRIQMTPAIHGSALDLPNGGTLAMGIASGFLIRAGGRTLYHAGDTALFGDMALIGRHGLDAALIPIGDFYTMGPADAIDALNLLRPKLAVPMHYGTNAKIDVDPHAFAAKAATAGHTVRVMKPGETIEL